MGSICQDKAGNMGLLYTVANANTNIPASIAYTGRLVGDPLRTMTQGETIGQAGNGYQTVARWGDYAQINIDPVDGKFY